MRRYLINTTTGKYELDLLAKEYNQKVSKLSLNPKEIEKLIEIERIKESKKIIIKNEDAIIERCLTSILPLVDAICITDTGSTDNTPQIIKDFFKKNGIKGEIHYDEWCN